VAHHRALPPVMGLPTENDWAAVLIDAGVFCLESLIDGSVQFVFIATVHHKNGTLERK